MKNWFLAPLSNANSSILKLQLENGYLIRAFDQDQIVSIISTLENIEPLAALATLGSNYSAFNMGEKKTYAVCKSIEAIDDSTHGAAFKLLNEAQNYLYPTTRLLRLFKSGNISVPAFFVYLGEDANKPTNLLMAMRSNKTVLLEPFVLEDRDIQKLDEFLRSTRIPFAKNFLQLAFDNFETSYETMPQSIAFLSLMLSVEALLSPSDQHELTHRVSRRAAILLGYTFEERNEKFREMQEFYDKRSQLVHTGASNISSEDLSKLRAYVRQLIKEIYSFGCDKQDLGNSLDRLGFREQIAIS